MGTIKKSSKIVEKTEEKNITDIIEIKNVVSEDEREEVDVSTKEKRELYMKVQRILKNAKIEKYMEDRDLIAKEGLTFWGALTGRNSLQIQRIENIKLKIELLEAQRIEEKDNYEPIDMLADIYSCAISELNGKFSEQMRSIYNQIKIKYCKEDISDDDIYMLVFNKVEHNQNYLPTIHKEKSRGIFGDTKTQIEFFKMENKKLQNQIVIERGKNQFEEIKKQTIIPPLKNVSVAN